VYPFSCQEWRRRGKGVEGEKRSKKCGEMVGKEWKRIEKRRGKK
jgi:hypothetical protein